MTTASAALPAGLAATTVRPDLWHLSARTDRVVAVAQQWRELSGAGLAASARLSRATAPLAQAWSGPSAQAYRFHRDRLFAAFDTLSTVSDGIADALTSVAATLATAQDHLDDSWARLVRRAGVDESVPGRPGVARDGAAALAAATAEAHDIRAHADDRLTGLADTLVALRRRFGPAALALRYDEDRPWPTPPELARAGAVSTDGDRVILDATGGADTVEVDTDPRTGELVVTVDGVVRRFPSGTDLVVRTGSGDDRITVAADARVRLTVLAGSGDDTVRGGPGDESILGLAGRDTITGGGGGDYLSGGGGADYLDGQAGADLLDGGTGDDVLYGLDGDDGLWGGAGIDYADGGAGSDVLAGGGGSDALMGGRGADTVLGGAGDDRLYGGDGVDRIAGGPGDNHVFAQAGDEVSGAAQRVDVPITDAGTFIQVSGTPDFVARVQSDLDALRSSPAGAQMLTTLQGDHDRGHSDTGAALPGVGRLFQGDTLVIRQTDDLNGYAEPDVTLFGPVHDNVQYNPTFAAPRDPPGPPLVVLYHELAHVEDAYAGTMASGIYRGADNPGVPNLEREAVGLPIDDDHDPTTPDRLDPDHPFALTENGLRQELHLPARTAY